MPHKIDTIIMILRIVIFLSERQLPELLQIKAMSHEAMILWLRVHVGMPTIQLHTRKTLSHHKLMFFLLLYES